MEWYVIERDGIIEVVAVTDGNDPLYGRGSWSLAISRSFDTAEAAEEAAAKLEADRQ